MELKRIRIGKINENCVSVLDVIIGLDT